MTTATKSSLYINQNGMICCIAHGGSYLQSEYQHAPERRNYLTPLDSWEKVDAEMHAILADMDDADLVLECETCRR